MGHKELNLNPRRFRPYPAYKPSGVDWLGDIPEDWRELPIWNLFTRKTDRSHEDLELLSVYRDHGVIIKSSRDDNYNKPSLDLSAYLRVVPSDLVTNKMKTWQGSIAISEYEGIVSPAYYTCRAVHKEHDRYIHYLLRCEKYVAVYMSLSKGIRVNQWDLEYENFRLIPVILPPVPEQRTIAAFLDREKAKIDALVAKKERLIELLEERRTALISRAVTRGLDPDAPLKPSGVPWLGEIPVGWEVSRLKYLSTINNDVLSESTDPEYEILYVDISSVDSITGITIKEPMIFRNAPSRARRLVRHGDVIISTVRTYLRAITPMADPEPNLVVSTGFAVIRPSEGLDTSFAAYALRASYLVDSIVARSVGVSYPGINPSSLVSIFLVKPNLHEQLAIAAFLDRETAKIDALVAKVREGIEKLKEYRTALISAAVTGKIDVRGYV